jgi:C4-dicarboxylate transporter DctQ subunit
MNAVDNVLSRIEECIVAVGISSASVVLFVNVVLRYVFNSGWEWAEEVARYTIVWLVFLGGSICARKGMHLAVDALTVRMKPGGQRAVRIVVDAVCIVFCAFLVVCGKDLVDLARETEQLTAALEIPIYWVYLAIPTGGALMAVRFAQDLVKAVKGIEADHVKEAS